LPLASLAKVRPLDMSLPGFLQLHPKGVFLSIKVQPRAASNAIVGVSGDELKVRVTAPPVDSAANEAVLRFLSDIFQCPRNALHVQRGLTSRHKRIYVQGVTAERILVSLGAITGH